MTQAQDNQGAAGEQAAQGAQHLAEAEAHVNKFFADAEKQCEAEMAADREAKAAEPWHEALRVKLAQECWYCESGLDTAGASNSAAYFGDLAHLLHTNGSPVEALLEIFDRYGERNLNKGLAERFLRLALNTAYQHAIWAGNNDA